MKNDNKGFSLIELIVVIAIMAILVGVLAPNVLRYVEKSNVSADTQLADAIRTAVITAMLDPTVINDSSNSAAKFVASHPSSGTPAALSKDLEGEMLKAVNVTLGFAADTAADALQAGLIGKLKSAHGDAAAINVTVTGSNAVAVTITTTDATGNKKTDGTASPIAVD